MCEGEVTEAGYFADLRRLHRAVLSIEISPKGKPKTLVERATRMKKDAERDARKESDDNLRFDFVWCVFDTDDHPGIPEAKQRARDNGINLAISNPCFEIWILLHFQDHRSHVQRKILRAMCRTYLPDYVKEVPCDELRSTYQQATERAAALVLWHEQQGREQHSNPSTGVYRLTEQIRELGNQKNRR